MQSSKLPALLSHFNCPSQQMAALLSPGVGNWGSVRSQPNPLWDSGICKYLGSFSEQVKEHLLFEPRALFNHISPHPTWIPAVQWTPSTVTLTVTQISCKPGFLGRHGSVQHRECWKGFKPIQFGYQEVPQQNSIIPHKNTALLVDKLGFCFIVPIFNLQLLDLLFLTEPPFLLDRIHILSFSIIKLFLTFSHSKTCNLHSETVFQFLIKPFCFFLQLFRYFDMYPRVAWKTAHRIPEIMESQTGLDGKGC